MIIFPDLLDVEVERVEMAEEITLTLRTVSPTALCPSCGTASSRIQSRYTRTLRDLPSVGRPLRLIMHVRRFFCKKSTCAQKIFVERLAELCHPHAQRTKRLQEALCQLGLTTGVRREQILEASWVSAEVAIPSYVWFVNRNRLPNQNHISLVWTIGHGNVGCVMEH